MTPELLERLHLAAGGARLLVTDLRAAHRDSVDAEPYLAVLLLEKIGIAAALADQLAEIETLARVPAQVGA